MAERKRSLLPSAWRPFSHFPSLFDEANDWFPDLATFSNERGLSVSEDNGSVLVEAAVPGLKPEDLEISLDRGTLWVKGQKSEEEEEEERKYYRKASKSYSYYTSLPEGVDLESEPEATCEDGVVKITFSKKESSEPKKIEVKKS